MTASIYTSDGPGRFVPTEHAVGPWHPEQLHGGAPGALLADLLQASAPDMQITRITYEFLGPVTLAPCEVGVEIVKPGKRLQNAQATLSVDGRIVAIARAAMLRRGAVELPAAAAWPPPDPRAGDPAAGTIWTPAVRTDSGAGFGFTAMEIHAVEAAMAPGRALVWFRVKIPLVDDRPPSPIARVVAAADFGNGISRVVEFTTHLFVNTDLTVQLTRDPEGEWVLLDAQTNIETQGVGLAYSLLADPTGPLGLAAQSLFVTER